MVSPIADRAEPDGDVADADRQPLVRWCAWLVLASVVFTVYRFCDVAGGLYSGSVAETVLDAMGGAVSGLFVIIGFVLSRSLLAGRRTTAAPGGVAPTGRVRLLAWWAIRLLPAYYLAVIVVWFARQSRLPGDWADLLEHLSFTQVFDPQRIFYTVGPAWVVSVAVLTGLLLVGLVTVVRRGTAASRTGAAEQVALVGIVLGFALLSWWWKGWSYGVLDRAPRGSYVTWYGPLANLDVFAVGMALALLAARRPGRGLAPGISATLRLTGVGVLIASTVLRDQQEWLTVYFTTFTGLGFGLLLAPVMLGPTESTKASSARAVTRPWVGPVALNVLLWHEPAMLALRPLGLVRQAPGAFVPDLLVVLIATGSVAWSVYLLVQLPIGRLVLAGSREPRHRHPAGVDGTAGGEAGGRPRRGHPFG